MQNAISLKATTNSLRKSGMLVRDNSDRTACGERLLDLFFKSTGTFYESSIHWIGNKRVWLDYCACARENNHATIKYLFVEDAFNSNNYFLKQVATISSY